MKKFLQIFNKILIKRVSWLSIANFFLILLNGVFVIINFDGVHDSFMQFFSWCMNLSIFIILSTVYILLLTLDILHEYKKLKPKGQIISSQDPYGEENWE